MAIRRRVKSGRKLSKLVRRVKTTEWERLYNRLHEDDDSEVYEAVAIGSGLPDAMEDAISFLESILVRFDAKVETLQINYPAHVTHRVCLAWTDYSAKPQYGYLYPRLAVIAVDKFLIRAAVLAYLSLCKQARKWL